MAHQNHFLTAELLEQTSEFYIAGHLRSARLIYLVSILSLTILIVALPFILVDVSVRSNGVME